jgi:magnesium chelatase subunit I
MKERIEIVRRRDAYERSPDNFIEDWAEATGELRDQITRARALMGRIEVPESILEKAVELCCKLGADGLRGELTLLRAARARAALNGEDTVSEEMLKSVAVSALRHRLRKDPLDDTDASVRVERAMAEVLVS